MVVEFSLSQQKDKAVKAHGPFEPRPSVPKADAELGSDGGVIFLKGTTGKFAGVPAPKLTV